MTTSTQILRVCSKRMVSATCTRNLTVVTSPLLFRNDTMKYSAVTGTGMSVTRTENWFKRKYNDIKNSYLQVANRVRKLYITLSLYIYLFGTQALITSSTSGKFWYLFSSTYLIQTSCGVNRSSLLKWLLQLQNCLKINGVSFFSSK